MSTQTKLTLSSVLVMTAIVAIISILDLGYQMDAQFQATLEHAEMLKSTVVSQVVDALNRDRLHPWRETLRNSNLDRSLVDILSVSHAVLEIAVCDNNNEILIDSDPKAVGKPFPHYADFQPIVNNANWLDKVRILNQPTYYQLEEPLGTPGKRELYVRVVIYPALIKAKDIMPTLKKSASVALASLAGALCITLLFSIIAFRPLGRLGHMLDHFRDFGNLRLGLFPLLLIHILAYGCDRFCAIARVGAGSIDLVLEPGALRKPALVQKCALHFQ